MLSLLHGAADVGISGRVLSSKLFIRWSRAIVCCSLSINSSLHQRTVWLWLHTEMRWGQFAQASSALCGGERLVQRSRFVSSSLKANDDLADPPLPAANSSQKRMQGRQKRGGVRLGSAVGVVAVRFQRLQVDIIMASIHHAPRRRC